MKTYVLIQTEADRDPVAQELRLIPGVVSAEDLSGAYDAIALARVDSTRHPVDGIVAEIRNIPGVTRALPAPVNGTSREDPQPSDRERSGSRSEAA